MILTLVLLSIGALLFLVIGYNIIQQYRQKIEAEKRATIAKQKAIIDETEELLLNASRMPFSKELILLLHRRIADSLKLILSVDSQLAPVRQRLKNIQGTIEQVQNNYQAPDESLFRSPDSDRDALQLLQLVKKIRAVLRSEHAKGKVNTQNFVVEDRKLELTQLKINIENAMKRAYEARAARQFGTAKQLLAKGINALSALSDRDTYLNQKLAEMQQLKEEIDAQQSKASKQHIQEQQEKETDELDVLFQPKKKW